MQYFQNLCTVIFIVIAAQTNAQIPTNSSIFNALKKADSLVFTEGFNRCNFSALKKILHKDLEFLHDQNGTQDLNQFYEAFTKSICSDSTFKPIRKLIPETLQVFSLHNKGQLYGAIQTGDHVFYIKEPNKDAYATSKGKFIHTWVLENEQWKLKRIVSYEHAPPEEEYGAKFNADYILPLFNNDHTIETLLKKHQIPSISIGYIKNGALQQIRAFGSKKEGKPVTHNSLYKIASLTKPICAIVVLKLINKEVWSLDEPVSTYFVDPDIANSPYMNTLTTRHILSHQSGFPNWRYLTADKKLAFQFEPGTQFQYSGEGFEYLRKAIEHKLNRPFEAIATEILFEPLGMDNTHFYWTPEVNEDKYAVEHNEQGKPIAFKKYTRINAAANVITTAEDYSKFLLHILDGAGLSQPLYRSFISTQANQQKGIDWGLGMQLLSGLPNNELAIMHTGGDYGTKTIAILLQESKQGLVLFTNSENGMVLWQKIITEYFGDIGKEIVTRNLQE